MKCEMSADMKRDAEKQHTVLLLTAEVVACGVSGQAATALVVPCSLLLHVLLLIYVSVAPSKT